jgi:hypothetical protein
MTIKRYDFDYTCDSFIESCDGLWVPAPDYDALKSKSDELIAALEEYNNLLGDELSETVSYAAPHGWQSSRYEKGKELRERIEQLKGELR